MAVERETSQEEISSFASLLKTFLPDHSDLPLMGSTEELLQHVKGSMQENANSDCKQIKGKDGKLVSRSHLDVGLIQEHSSHRHVEGMNHFHHDIPAHLADSGHCNRKDHFGGSSPKNIPAQLVGSNHCDTYKLACSSHHNTSAHLAKDNQCNTSEQHMDYTQCNTVKQLACNNKVNALEEELVNLKNSSLPVPNDYDSDATLDVADYTEIHGATVPKEDNCSSVTSSIIPPICPDYMKHYACFICDETFLELTKYSVHMKCHHNHNTGSIKCSDCGETLESKALYISHRKLFTYELWGDRAKAGQSMDTEDSSDNSPSKKARTRKRGADEHYVCSICWKHFHKYSSFLKHTRTHRGVMAFTCAVCQESFHASCLLRYHIDLHHSHVLPFQCKRCLRRFKLKCSLSTHLRYCDIDPGSLPFAEEMQFIDQLSQQRKYQGPEADEEGMSQYSCPICTLMFDTPEELKSHMSYHDETKPYKCGQCGRGFRSRHVLRKHASVHAEKHECRCEICGVQLLTLSGYNAHLRGHQNQEKIQAQFFPQSNLGAKEDVKPETALQILQRIKRSNDIKLEAETDESTTQIISTSKSTGNRKLKNYKCPICGMLFYTGGVKFQLHAHKEHKDDAEFEKCKLCSKTFVGKDNLEKHVRLHNMFADSYSCDECGKTFRRKFAMQVHKNMHTFKKFVKCDICGQEFRFVSEVEKHKNRKHRYDRLVNIYKCGICGQRFPMLSHLSVHCYCHNLPGAKPFECDLCKLAYHTSVELKKHIFEMHDKLMMKHSGALHISDTEDTIDAIPKTEISDKDGVAQKQDDTEKVDNVAQSNFGDITFRSKPDLLNESKDDKDISESVISKVCIKTEVLDFEEEIEQAIQNNADGKNYNRTMALPSNVEAYNLATRQFYHQSKFLKRYMCEVCQKAFSSNSDLKTHRRTHSGETPFKCDYCDRSFKQRGHRKLHIQVVHTKEMPYKCDQCDSAFPTRYRYQIHIKRHSGVREHQCAYCEKGFYTLGKLNEHSKKRHPEEWKREQEEKDEVIS